MNALSRALVAVLALLYAAEWSGGRAAAQSAAHGDAVTVLCSNAIKGVMEALAPQLDAAAKRKVNVTYGLAAVLKQQIEQGAAFDVAVLTPPLIDDLIKQRKVASDTRAPIARSPMALAIRKGAARSDLSTVDAVKRTLTTAASVAYAKQGASGIFFTALVERLGIGDAMATRLRPTATGEEVSGAVARGDAQLGVLPMSEIVIVPGVEVLGTFPAEIQSYAVMVAGARRDAAQDSSIQAVIRLLQSTAAQRVLKEKGMEPAPHGT